MSSPAQAVSFVTAFRGRRDGYEVPVALAERGLLDAFLTDQFCGPLENTLARVLPARLAEKLRGRYDPRLPADRVRRLRITALREALYRRSADSMYDRFDPDYGRATAAIARRHRSNLFLYSPYAMPALTARYPHDPRKVVFQFHPHVTLERRILSDDLRHPTRQRLSPTQEFDSVLTPVRSRLVADESWRLADHIVCASTFTKRSLIEEGSDGATISVIPYGVDLPQEPDFTAPDTFRALFVGTGVYRKGLHHLLAAWEKARLAKDARLTIVSRTIEPELMRLMKSVDGIDYRPGVSAVELDHLYATSTLFVMPSLVEGFGQVYLEALAHGLPVLGTANTCVPDLGTAQEGLFCTAPGQSDALAAQLEDFAMSLPGNADIRRRARGVAERHPWSTFRERIGAVAAPAAP